MNRIALARVSPRFCSLGFSLFFSLLAALPGCAQKMNEGQATQFVRRHVAARAAVSENSLLVSFDNINRLRLPNLGLASVRLGAEDHYGRNCFVVGQKVYCHDELDALERVVEAHDLGASPRKLDDLEWVKLVSFAYHLSLVQSAADLNGVLQVPSDVQRQLQPPQVQYPAEGGGRVTAYSLLLDPKRGPQGIERVDVTIAPNHPIACTRQTVFNKR